LSRAHFLAGVAAMAKRIKKRLHRREPSGLRPDWRPLIEFAPDEVPDFMWMFRDFLEDGVVVEAYKHVWTRQYLHLDASGRAYVFVGGVSYEEVDPPALLHQVLWDHPSRASIVRQNDWVDGKRIRWARSATTRTNARWRSSLSSKGMAGSSSSIRCRYGIDSRRTTRRR